MTYQNSYQINGTDAHAAVDKGTYSGRKNIMTAVEVYSEKYNLVGKIDIYDGDTKTLTERKRQIKTIYDGYVFQIYTMLFNLIDALLNVYGFDEYYGVFHRCFYMRKSLVCDLQEPFRPIIDYATRKAINLKQIREDDFTVYNMRYVLDWKKSPEYMQIYLKEILKYKEEMFLYIQGYYRAVMKQKPIEEYPVFVYKG